MQDTLSKGEDVAAAVMDALAQESSEAWIDGFGVVEAPVLEVLEADGMRAALRLEGRWDLVHLRASLTVGERATVLVAREGQLHAGLLVNAAARGVALRSTGGPAVRSVAPPKDGAGNTSAAPPAAASTPIELPSARRDEIRGLAEEAPQPNAAASEGSQPGKPSYTGGAVMPPKLAKKEAWMEESYPEEGDRVTHFAFGDCSVVGSDGERIRLQQDRDSRVREVALSMLKLAAPTVDAEGVRHWVLGRKN
jgi:hypothetical protein